MSAPLPGSTTDGQPDRDSQAAAALCVLASGSSGNCSILAITSGGITRLCLIDLGLSLRRTTRLLDDLGFGLHQVDDVILTHLDGDHLYEGWLARMPRHIRLHMHERHALAAGLPMLFGPTVETFRDGLVLRDGTSVRAFLAPHDELGVSTLRFISSSRCGADWSLGFATDIGQACDDLVEHLREVDCLAIESNYCPHMQLSSGRSEQLIRRIMGGSGHLSNRQAFTAIQQISPRRDVVLLHLSRQCNDPALVASLHQQTAYRVTITSQFKPTPWVTLAGNPPAASPALDLVTIPERSSVPAR